MDEDLSSQTGVLVSPPSKPLRAVKCAQPGNVSTAGRAWEGEVIISLSTLLVVFSSRLRRPSVHQYTPRKIHVNRRHIVSIFEIAYNFIIYILNNCCSKQDCFADMEIRVVILSGGSTKLFNFNSINAVLQLDTYLKMMHKV